MSQGLAAGFAIVGALLLAVVVTFMQKRASARVIGYLGCVLLAIAPFTGTYAPFAFGAFVIAIVASGLIGHREWSRRVGS